MFEGKNNWFVRYPFISWLLGMFCLLGFYLVYGTLGSFILFCVGVGILTWMYHQVDCDYDWVCSKCNRKAFVRDKYCCQCGGLMVLTKRQKKRCLNGHWVTYGNFCPKCGAEVVQ